MGAPNSNGTGGGWRRGGANASRNTPVGNTPTRHGSSPIGNPGTYGKTGFQGDPKPPPPKPSSFAVPKGPVTFGHGSSAPGGPPPPKMPKAPAPSTTMTRQPGGPVAGSTVTNTQIVSSKPRSKRTRGVFGPESYHKTAVGAGLPHESQPWAVKHSMPAIESFSRSYEWSHPTDTQTARDVESLRRQHIGMNHEQILQSRNVNRMARIREAELRRDTGSSLVNPHLPNASRKFNTQQLELQELLKDLEVAKQAKGEKAIKALLDKVAKKEKQIEKTKGFLHGRLSRDLTSRLEPKEMGGPSTKGVMAGGVGGMSKGAFRATLSGRPSMSQHGPGGIHETDVHRLSKVQQYAKYRVPQPGYSGTPESFSKDALDTFDSLPAEMQRRNQHLRTILVNQHKALMGKSESQTHAQWKAEQMRQRAAEEEILGGVFQPHGPQALTVADFVKPQSGKLGKAARSRGPAVVTAIDLRHPKAHRAMFFATRTSAEEATKEAIAAYHAGDFREHVQAVGQRLYPSLTEKQRRSLPHLVEVTPGTRWFGVAKQFDIMPKSGVLMDPTNAHRRLIHNLTRGMAKEPGIHETVGGLRVVQAPFGASFRPGASVLGHTPRAIVYGDKLPHLRMADRAMGIESQVSDREVQRRIKKQILDVESFVRGRKLVDSKSIVSNFSTAGLTPLAMRAHGNGAVRRGMNKAIVGSEKAAQRLRMTKGHLPHLINDGPSGKIWAKTSMGDSSAAKEYTMRYMKTGTPDFSLHEYSTGLISFAVLDASQMNNLRLKMPLLLQEAANIIAFGIHEGAMQVFARRGIAPRWAPLARSTKMRKRHDKPMYETGALARGLRVSGGMTDKQEASWNANRLGGENALEMRVGWDDSATPVAHRSGDGNRPNLAQIAADNEFGVFGTGKGQSAPNQVRDAATGRVSSERSFEKGKGFGMGGDVPPRPWLSQAFDVFMPRLVQQADAHIMTTLRQRFNIDSRSFGARSVAAQRNLALKSAMASKGLTPMTAASRGFGQTSLSAFGAFNLGNDGISRPRETSYFGPGGGRGSNIAAASAAPPSIFDKLGNDIGPDPDLI